MLIIAIQKKSSGMSPLARVQNIFQKRQVKVIEVRIPGSLLLKAKI
jgi:hypothetical protein